MKLSFVIPAYNEQDNIAKCLVSVCEQAAAYPGQVEIIVVDNASTDRTGEIARAFSGVNVIEEPHKGLVRARHAGYTASSGELIANVDSDTVLMPGWLNTVFKEFSANPGLVGLSGPFKYTDLKKHHARWVDFFYRVAHVVYFVNRFILRKGSMLQGGNFVVTRAGMEKIGGFDTSIEFYGEDTDIARRLFEVGDVKFTRKLQVYSSGRRLAAEGLFTMATRYTKNYFWMIFLKRPHDQKYIDVRSNHYKTVPRAREFAMALQILGVLAAIVIVGTIAIYAIGKETVFVSLSLFKNEVKEEVTTLSVKTKDQFKDTLQDIRNASRSTSYGR